MTCHGYPSYIDHFIYCELPSKIKPAYHFVLRLLSHLGLDITSPEQSPYMEDKLSEIVRMCEQWKSKSTCSKLNCNASLVLYFIFPNVYVLSALLSIECWHFDTACSHLRDLKWFCTFQIIFNGVIMHNKRPINEVMYLDASHGPGRLF